jgi:hypothetical protein
MLKSTNANLKVFCFALALFMGLGDRVEAREFPAAKVSFSPVSAVSSSILKFDIVLETEGNPNSERFEVFFRYFPYGQEPISAIREKFGSSGFYQKTQVSRIQKTIAPALAHALNAHPILRDGLFNTSESGSVVRQLVIDIGFSSVVYPASYKKQFENMERGQLQRQAREQRTQHGWQANTMFYPVQDHEALALSASDWVDTPEVREAQFKFAAFVLSAIVESATEYRERLLSPELPWSTKITLENDPIGRQPGRPAAGNVFEKPNENPSRKPAVPVATAQKAIDKLEAELKVKLTALYMLKDDHLRAFEMIRGGLIKYSAEPEVSKLLHSTQNEFLIALNGSYEKVVKKLKETTTLEQERWVKRSEPEVQPVKSEESEVEPYESTYMRSSPGMSCAQDFMYKISSSEVPSDSLEFSLAKMTLPANVGDTWRIQSDVVTQAGQGYKDRVFVRCLSLLKPLHAATSSSRSKSYR